MQKNHLITIINMFIVLEKNMSNELIILLTPLDKNSGAIPVK